jgi:outer membrane protein X
MKPLFYLILLSLPLVGFGQSRIGTKIAYGSEIESFAIGGKATFGLDNRFSISPEIMYFFENDNVSAFTLNGDLHYALNNNWSGFKPYLIGGVNYTDLDLNNGRFDDRSDSEWGLNLGFGAAYPISSSVRFISEVKYVLSDFDQLVIGVGFLVDM